MEKFVELVHMMEQLITDKNSIYDFEVVDIHGNLTKLEAYRGKVVLVVNVASMCRFASQYESLQTLYRKYHEMGFEVLAFPSYEFDHLEFDTDLEIEQFVKSRYGITFPIFQPLCVNGEKAHPLFKYLKSNNKEFLEDGAIQWNFTKFLINQEGNVINRYSPITQPLSFEEDIATLLNTQQ